MMFTCKTKNEEWENIFTRIHSHKDYLSYTIIGNCMSVKTLLGVDDGIVWICFPDREKSCTLAHPNDVFWNKEKLTHLLNSEKEGLAIARSVQELQSALSILEIKL